MSLSISVALIFFSCKKANDERNEANKPSIAIAEPDQVISLSTDRISLDGTSSSDLDGTINEWLRKKFRALLLLILIMQAGVLKFFTMKSILIGAFRYAFGTS